MAPQSSRRHRCLPETPLDTAQRKRMREGHRGIGQYFRHPNNSPIGHQQHVPINTDGALSLS